MPRNQSLAVVPAQEAGRFLSSTSIRILIFGRDELETRDGSVARCRCRSTVDPHSRSCVAPAAAGIRTARSAFVLSGRAASGRQKIPGARFRRSVASFPRVPVSSPSRTRPGKKDVVAQLFSHDSDHRIRLRPSFSPVERDTTHRAPRRRSKTEFRKTSGYVRLCAPDASDLLPPLPPRPSSARPRDDEDVRQ